MEEVNKDEINALPVYYCARCLSLNVKYLEDTDYCEDCGGTEIKETTIDLWEHYYVVRHGHRYLEDKNK